MVVDVVSDFLVVAVVSDFLVVSVDDFLVVDFFVVEVLAGAFLVVAALSVVDVVVADSFLLAQEVIKPTVARIAMDVIRDFFIRYC